MSEPLNPSESAVRRALTRAERGVTLDAVEAETLLHARGLGEGEPLDRLLTAAYLAWTVVWVAMVWGLAALAFSRRDL